MAMQQYGNAREAEYYFEYQLERFFGDEQRIQPPQLYFERDYEKRGLPYTMFAVMDDWLGKEKVLEKLKDQSDAKAARRALSELEYDTVNVVFDIKGIECAALADKTSKAYEKAESKVSVSFEKFYDSGCRVLIENSTTEDHSGIGVIEMLKGKEVVAQFFFAVNFTFKKTIHYSLKRVGKELSLVFECTDRPKGVPVTVVYNKDRLPCLKQDKNVNVVDQFTLDFSKSKKYKKECKLTDTAEMAENIFSVNISSAEFEKYYILSCYENNTLRGVSGRMPTPTVTYTCPYCQNPMDVSLKSSKKFLRGAVPCTAKMVDGKKVEVKGGIKRAKRCIYCSEDLDKAGDFSSKYSRLLPPSYMDHDICKIAFAGSKRAGKTTYLSRFFGVEGFYKSGGQEMGSDGKRKAVQADKISMTMLMAKNSLAEFGVSVTPASMPLVQVEKGVPMLTTKDWSESAPFYCERAISLNPSFFPQSTQPQDEVVKNPFITEVNRKNYVAFYDIAGEDAQHSTQIHDIVTGCCGGVFCLINGKADVTANAGVVGTILKAKLPEQTPIAVIIAKGDMIEGDFDASCRCLRTDYFHPIKKYEGSALEREIDFSSEEIYAYLVQSKLVPNFAENYKNVKYFSVASFNFWESIHNPMEDINDPGKVKFDCSCKRMELPFIWMLKQF
ncbi:MAG: hypothetical protein J6A87_03225, partial [Clostridia bacterium]|nr:hypothetical protein [Clostridia bacterium]